MKKNITIDHRVKVDHYSWKGVLVTFVTLFILSSIQSFILYGYLPDISLPFDFWIGMAGFWAIVSLIFSLATHYQIRKKFEHPMRRLGTAARKVANGDFSVNLSPPHSPEKYDYMDVMYEDFNTMVSELASTEILKNDFIANISHELKTPLAVIQNYVMTLQKDDLPKPTRKEYFDTIMGASKNLTTLVTNILKLNKLENQEIILNKKNFDLCEQLCGCILHFESIWEAKNIEIEADIEERFLINADEDMLEIVWNNIISNAVKFTEPGGKITIRQFSDDDSVTVSVRDTGCGMDESTLSHIYDKFYQGCTSHSKEGNGLGLALALRVVELMDGNITVRSEPGQGTEFNIVLKR